MPHANWFRVRPHGSENFYTAARIGLAMRVAIMTLTFVGRGGQVGSEALVENWASMQMDASPYL